MSFKKFIIYSPENNVHSFPWRNKLKDFTVIDTKSLRKVIVDAINGKISFIRLGESIGLLNGEIKIEYLPEEIVSLEYSSRNFKIKLPKTEILEETSCKKITSLCHLISLIEMEILRQSRGKTLLVSDSIKRISSKDIYFIAIYVFTNKDNAKITFPDYYIDFSTEEWVKNAIEVISSKSENKTANYFKTIEYDKFFANQESNTIIESLRDYVRPSIKNIQADQLFDKLDLEIQTLIASTWLNKKDLFSGSTVNTKVVDDLISKQLRIIVNRYKIYENILPVKELLQGEGIFNGKTRYWIDGENIYAVPVENGFIHKLNKVEIEFKKVDDEIAINYESCFHYIHNKRHFSLTLGLFLKGNKFPYAISILDFLDSRHDDFKTMFLEQAGINKEQCVDEVRLYSFPWSPMLTSSLLADLVRKYLIVNFPNVTSSITAVNRNLFKGTYINQAHYVPLALKPTTFNYKEMLVDNEVVKFYQGSFGMSPVNSSSFPLLPTVEFYRPIKKDIQVNIEQGKVFNISA